MLELLTGTEGFLSFVLGAGGEVPQIVLDIGWCLIISAVLCALFVKLKIPVIAAFLAGGVLLGPIGFKVITDTNNIDAIASLGLTLLLFVIGLEINVKKLLASGKALILTGLAQFPLCVGFGLAVGLAVQSTGWEIAGGKYMPLYAGFTAAASSTLLVVKLLQEKFQMDTVPGRMSIGILIFQDIWAIVVLAIQPNFDDPQIGGVALTFLSIAILTGIAVGLAKFVLPMVFGWLAKMPELLLVLALGWCFGIGVLGENLEPLLGLAGLHIHLHVSMSMGALIAGAAIASLPYAHEVVSKVIVVRDFFVTLFFVGLGMGIPAVKSADVIFLAAILAGVAMVARYLIFFPLFYFNGLDRRNAFVTSTKLAQVSEFCLVIAYLGTQYGHINKDTNASIIFAFVLTALITPNLFVAGDAIHDKIGGLLSKLGFKAPTTEKRDDGKKAPTIALLGFHRIASSLLHEIGLQRPNLVSEVTVIDFNVALHDKIKKTGTSVHYGDMSNEDVLRHNGVDVAKVIVCTIPDDVLKGTDNRKLTAMLRGLNPNATIIANAVSISDVAPIYEAGANYVFLYRVDSARNLLPALDAAMDGSIDLFVESSKAGKDEFSAREEVLD